MFQVNSMASLDWKTYEREWDVQICLNIDCYYEIGKHLNPVQLYLIIFQVAIPSSLSIPASRFLWRIAPTAPIRGSTDFWCWSSASVFTKHHSTQLMPKPIHSILDTVHSKANIYTTAKSNNKTTTDSRPYRLWCILDTTLFIITKKTPFTTTNSHWPRKKNYPLTAVPSPLPSS